MAPPEAGALLEREEHTTHRGDEQDGAGEVEALPRRGGRPAQQLPAGGYDDGADGDTDVEGPAPAGILGDQAADDGAAQRDGLDKRSEESLRPRALGGGERLRDERAPVRLHQGCADALHDASGDEPAEGGREAAQDRPTGEDGRAGEEDFLAP